MEPPLMPNPNGALPDYENGPSLLPAVVALGVPAIAISAMTMGLRLYANMKHSGRLGLDDALCVLGWVTATASWTISYTIAADGITRHAWDVPASAIDESVLKRAFTQIFVGTFALWAGKASILVLFIRLFKSVRWVTITCYLLILFMTLFYLTCMGIWTAYTAPRPGTSWSVEDLNRLSSNPVNLASVVATGVFSVAISCVMVILPFPVIIGLRLGVKQRARLVVVFSVALCTVVAACASVVYRVRFLEGAKGDITWVQGNIWITTSAEQFGTLIVSCAPALSSFWHNIFTQTRLYSAIRSTFSPQRSIKESKILEEHDTNQGGSDVCLPNRNENRKDMYPITDPDLRSQASAQDTVSSRPSSGFITSAIKLTTHIETRSTLR